MLTRARTRKTAQPSDSDEGGSQSGADSAGRLGRSPVSDHRSADATLIPAPHAPSTSTPRHSLAGNNKQSAPLPSTSSRSSASARARRLTAEAQLARREMEREQQLHEQEQKLELARQQLEHEHRLAERARRIEELEMEASLAAQEAAGSRTSVSRASSWVNDPRNHFLPNQIHNIQPGSQSKKFSCHTSKHVTPSPSKFKSLPVREQIPKETANYAVTTNNISPSRLSHKILQLMPFTGKPTEWLMFKRTYHDTEHLFTDTENLVRLRSALRGRALECVTALLYTADQPQTVIQMLEQTFAVPEVIVLNEILLVRNLPRLAGDHKDINLFASRLRNCIAVINVLNQREHLYSVEIFHALLGKLTPILINSWKEFAYRSDRSIPKLQLLSEFLDIEAEKHNRFGLILDYTKQIYPNHHQNSKPFRENINVTSTRTHNAEKCRYCSNKHKLTECNDFSSLSVDDKWKWLRDAKICYKCLRSKQHRWKTCKTNRCGVDGCRMFHNPLLHVPAGNSWVRNEPPATAINLSTEPINDSKIATITNTTECLTEERSSVQPRVLLRIIPVQVSGAKGKCNTFALLDDGSTATLIDSEVARFIGASGPADSIKVDGVAGMSSYKPIQHVNFTIKGLNCPQSFTVKNAKAMNTLSSFTQSINKTDLSDYPHLKDIINELILKDATPKVLLGAEHWYLTVSRETREGSRNQPVATRTALGWVLHGRSASWTKLYTVNHVSPDQAADVIIKDYFRLDSIGISTIKLSVTKQDKYALELLEATTTRTATGRFEVGLLWQKDIPSVPDSYPQALSRFLGLERRMARDVDFKTAYCTFINNMMEKGYAEECPRETYYDKTNLADLPNIRWYLPHFPVIHPQKKKLRVVHDAAAKTCGISLNSLLLPGPDLLQSLLHILFRFREGRIALTADVKEMFPQIRIKEQDRDALRYIWREDSNNELKEYRMTSVVFGAVCSPCIALYIKNRNPQELQNLYPAAAKAIINDHYMDDFLGSRDDENEASQLAADIVKVYKGAGMEMRGWVSNVPAALDRVPVELHAAPLENVHVGPEAFVRTLGLIWHPKSDTFSFRLGPQIPENTKLTKRMVLSNLMSIYDPLGLLTPFIIRGRILFQQTWRSGVDWDTELQPDIVRKWLLWSRKLASTATVKIPRWYRCGCQEKEIEDRQLHVFADASEEAYACVAYWRFTFSDRSVKLSLIGGKARLAPLKPTSIPRLELQAALIAARFADTIKKAHEVHTNATRFWTDSTTVLSWLRSDARTFKPFVANRVGEITDITNTCDWKFVPGVSNVADVATRLKLDAELSHWLSGPTFLLSPEAEWPREPTTSESSRVPQELKPAKILVGLTNLDGSTSTIIPQVSRFSEWLRLVRATARVYQAANKFRASLARVNENSKFPFNIAVTAADIARAETAILQQAQVESFGPEMALLRDSPGSINLLKSSRLRGLSPTLDEGLLKMNSRIKYIKDVDHEMTSPLILDGRHPAVQLLIRHYHINAAHAFNELVHNELRRKFWILRCRNAIRAVARSCATCAKRNAFPQIPPMGDLPEVRLAHHTRPFTNVGLDYFGPVEVTIGRRREKRWVALFTCMTTRAIHLEIVANLSADSAISSLRRFMARRGIPRKILSDNGTCFVGANRQLAKFYKQNVLDYAACKQCEWSFIPPAAPFMGGCWERLVRSVKAALRATLCEKAPREEVLHTLLLEAEALINSRPLTYIAQDGAYQSLTPFHFLIGSSSNLQLPRELDDGVFCLRKEWQKALRLSEHFWSRWLTEYLPSLRPRTRPPTQHQNISVGDVVLIADPNQPKGAWPMGRVTTVFPGRDGVVRVAEVMTQAGVLKRPTRKLALLQEGVSSESQP